MLLQINKSFDNFLSSQRHQKLTELYKAAGLTFDFSPENIKVLMDFVNEEMEKLN